MVLLYNTVFVLLIRDFMYMYIVYIKVGAQGWGELMERLPWSYYTVVVNTVFVLHS